MKHTPLTRSTLASLLLCVLLAGCQSTSSTGASGATAAGAGGAMSASERARMKSQHESRIAAAKKAAEKADAQFAAVEKLSAAAGPRPAPLPGYPTLNAEELRRQQALAYRSAAFHYGRLASATAQLAKAATDPAEKAAREQQTRELTAAAQAMWKKSQE